MTRRNTSDRRTNHQRTQDQWSEVHAKADGRDFEAPRRYRVGEIAERLAAADRAGRSEAYFAAQIRGWAQRGLLDWSGLEGSGRTASRIFDELAIYRAKALSVLTGLGLPPDRLRNVVAHHWFDQTIEQARNGQAVRFEVAVGDDGDCNYPAPRRDEEPVGADVRAPLYLVFDMRELLDGLELDSEASP